MREQREELSDQLTKTDAHVQKLQDDVTKATQDLADVKAENAGLHEQLKERTKEERETKRVRMELRDTNTAQKIDTETPV